MDDTFLLSRLQFALNISFHILFPAVTIGLGWMLVFFKIRYTTTRDRKWLDIYFLWTKVFALSFAIGVVSGITMPFQFGTNWPGFMETVGNIAGPLLAYEVILAFFLEATFLAIMLFAFSRVPNWFHTTATIIVAIGTTLSAFTILVLVSWMNTPQGFEMRDGIAYATSWYEIIFNPSMWVRFIHMMITSMLTATFMIAGISAYRWLRKDRGADVLTSLKIGTYLSAILIFAQVFVGDWHGLNTTRHNPQIMAAMEAVWKTEKAAPLTLFAIPDKETRTNKYEIAIPKMGSWFIERDFNAEVKGLDQFEEHAPVAPVFFAFRAMVGVGILMILASWPAAWFLIRRNRLPDWCARILVLMTFSGWVGLLAGWYLTEIGRQPYLVHGLLKTADAVTSLPPGNVLGTLITYAVIYAVLVPSYIISIFYLARRADKNAEPEKQGGHAH